MADVFISYAREDERTAERLAAALEAHGWSVFWDRNILAGPAFDDIIQRELNAASCVVVLWSATSIKSGYVKDEAVDARDRNILVPARLHDVKPPLGFRHNNYADLFGWPSDRDHVGYNHLVESITELAGPPNTTLEIPPAYLDWLRRTYADVDLLGQEADRGHAFQLGHIYVPALTAPPARADRTEGRERPEAEERRLVPLLERLNDESLIVLAPAGAGKSTFCRWAVLRSIADEDLCHPVPAPDDVAEPLPDRLRGRLPLLVPFREFAPRTDWGRVGQTWHRAELERALAAWVDAATPDLPGEVLAAHLRAGSAFLLLDGLDELPEVATREGVTVFPRELVLSGLADALPAWRKAGNRIFLTSRPAGMERAWLSRLRLDEAPLAPLPQEVQELFVRRWFHTLRKEELAPGLIATIDDRRQELDPLAENPMLLTALCILYDSGGRLPEDRYKLYRRIVDNVLFNRFPGGPRQTEPIKARLEAIALRMHEGTEDEPRNSPAAQVSEGEAVQVLRDIADEGWSEEDRRVEPAVRLDELLVKSGLLLPRPERQVAFYHLSFQEYLAAERMLRCSDDLPADFRARCAIPEWRLTLLFLFAGKVDRSRPDWGSRLLGRLIEEQAPAAVRANAAPAHFIAEALDLILAKNRPVPDAVRETFTRLTLDAIEDEVEVTARQALGVTLGRLGDPRIKSLRDPEAYVEVPAARYPYGKDKSEIVEITAPFRIGRYPVTNGQFQEFIEAGGYDPSNENGWWSDEGLAWLQEQGITEPWLWQDRRWNAPNQPVVGVSFWEAQACAAWAGGRLPTEQEWEAATRGPNGLAFPWGHEWEDGICNTSETGLDVTSPVGLFPRARQAVLGIEDLAGNVWEWCDSFYYPSNDEIQSTRVLRGGSWIDVLDHARAAFRFRSFPSLRYYSVGFRVVRSSPSSTTDS
ncbi:MAG: SUMF1/EgtB/PvdO family nonheme iron enzyme [Alphaproteobacteria bacterium]|jgi:formylglycine-generating enzyme required for sulfatase activity|nr:SUMF1/EgtB/PvdO family nonheme iron enzyme [Alphaproteobacteria bacterium]